MRINKAIKILLYGGNIWYFGEGMLGPLFAVFAQKIGGNILDIVWAWATYLIVTGVFYIIVGKIVDGHHSKTKVMIAGYALNTIFTFGYLLVRTPASLMLVQVGLGFAAALATPTWNALYTHYEDKNHDGYEWGLAGGTARIVTGLATLVGGLIVTTFSFNALFILMGCIQAIATTYQAKIFGLEKPRR